METGVWRQQRGNCRLPDCPGLSGGRRSWPEQHTARDQERQQRDDEQPGDVVQCIQQQQRQSLQRRVHCCQRSSSAESGSEH